MFSTNDTDGIDELKKDDMTIIEAVAAGFYNPDSSNANDTARSRAERNFYNDPKIYVCEGCKRVWQEGLIRGTIDYYDNLPTYKKPRRICKQCKTTTH